MSDAAVNSGGPALSADERRSLRALAGLMIPASADYDVPGADDEAIFADIVNSLGRDADPVRRALRCVNALSGRAFADLNADEQQSVARSFRDESPSLAAVLTEVTVRCYYRDDRVMRSLGMEPRPPFPKGFEVESGDWSLLDPVRARSKIYRDAP